MRSIKKCNRSREQMKDQSLLSRYFHVLSSEMGGRDGSILSNVPEGNKMLGFFWPQEW